LTCVPGQTQCVIQTYLLAGFYTSSGTINASGTATMQFGTASTSSGTNPVRQRRNRRRYLVVDEEEDHDHEDRKEEEEGRQSQYHRSSLSSSSSSIRSLQGLEEATTIAATPSEQDDNDEDDDKPSPPSSVTQNIMLTLDVEEGTNDVNQQPWDVDSNDIDAISLLLSEEEYKNLPLLKKWELLLNPNAVIDIVAALSTTATAAAPTPSYIISVVILVLMILNVLALMMLIFQHRRCRNTKLYL
jgi:hypothetical protein